MRSEFFDKTTDEVFDAYWGWLRRTRALYVCVVVLVGACAIASLLLANSWALYALFLAGVVAVATLFQLRVNKRFAALTAILNTDCDVEKWRGVIERVRDHGGVRRRATRDLCAIYLSIADCEEARYEDALARLDGMRAQKRGPVAVMFHETRAVYAHELGDDAMCAADVAALRSLCDGMRRGSARRSTVERALSDLEIGLKDPADWDEADERVARERLAAPQHHREQVAWAIRLAARALARGDADEARVLLDDATLEPMTPRARSRRAALLARLER